MITAMDRPIQRSAWQLRRKWLIGGTAAAAVIFLTVEFFSGAERRVRVAAASVTIEKVQQSVFHDFIPLRGKIVPHDTIYVDAASGGRIERVLVQPGDKVLAGQPLVEFSNTSLQLQVIQQESQLNQAITQLQSNEISLEQNKINNERALAQLDYDIIRLSRSIHRRDALASRGFTSAEQRDMVQDELDHDRMLRPLQAESNARQDAIRESQLPLIEDQLEKLRKNLDTVHSKLGDLVARSPVAGQVTDINLKIGESENPGERLATITPDTGNKLSADIDEFYLGRIHSGQMADVDVNGKNWQLKITRVYPQVKNGTFTVDLAFDGDTPQGLLPGQAVQGKLSLGDDTQGQVLPAGAYLERTGGDWVFVVARDAQSAERRRIKVGRRNAEQVEVLDGLKPGESVITSDYSGLERVDRVDLAK